MMIHISDWKEKQKSKNEFDKNLIQIVNFANLCSGIDVIVEKMNSVEDDIKYVYINQLIDMKINFINKMKKLDEENIEIMKEI